MVPVVGNYLSKPLWFFSRTKHNRDFESLALDLRSRVQSFPPGAKYLLIAERVGPGYLASPVFTHYLRWYGLDDKVVFRGTGNPKWTLQELAARCAGGCRGRPGRRFERDLESVLGAVAIPRSARRVLGVAAPVGRWPGTIGDVGVLSYSRLAGGPRVRGKRYWGFTLWRVDDR